MKFLQRNILIIESEAIVALDIILNFSNNGYNIIAHVSSLGEVLKNLKNFEETDIILVDSDLSDFQDKINTAEKYYRSFKKPLIILTSYIDDKILARCSKYETVKIIEKPINSDELIEVAGEMLKQLN